MEYLIDTSVLIGLEKGGKAGESIREFVNPGARKPFITLLTYSEYYYGSIRAGQQERATRFLGLFAPVTLSKDAAILFAELKYKYKQKGIMFSAIDLLNAATAIAERMTFITNDRSFDKIGELDKIII